MDNTPIHPSSDFQQPGGIALVVLLVILGLLVAGGAFWYFTIGTQTPPSTTQTRTTTPTAQQSPTSDPATILSEVEGDFSEIDELESELNADLGAKDQSVSF